MVLDELVGAERDPSGPSRSDRADIGTGLDCSDRQAAMERSVRWAQRARTRMLQLRADPADRGRRCR